MIGEELRESVLKWAKTQTEPFLTADVFENVEEAETLKEASDSLRKLFLSGDLARKKIDNVRFVYIDAEIAPLDFEKCLPDSGKNSSESAQACDEKKQETREEKAAPKQQRKSTRKASNPMNQGNIKVLHEIMEGAGLGDLLPKEAAIESANDTPIEFPADKKETALQNIKPLEIPEGFTLKLQAPGGLTITITTGSAQVQ